MRFLLIVLLLGACGEDRPAALPSSTPSRPPPPAAPAAPPAPVPACPEDAEGVRVTPEGLALAAPIGFDLYQGTIAPESVHLIDAVARRLAACPDLRLEIQVHTDSIGMTSFNARASQAVADAVKARLVEQGVDASRLAACGYGETHPIAPNTTVEGRARNARVEWRRIADPAAHACPGA